VARLATARKPAASTLSSGVVEPHSQPRTKPAQSAGTGVRHPAVAPVLNDREEPSLESEFMQAMQDYKKKSGRMFPTWSEVLEVLQSLGYRKADQEAIAAAPGPESVSS